MKKFDPNTLVGLDEVEAVLEILKNKLHFRIMSRDGQQFYSKFYYDKNRINLAIDKNKIIHAWKQ